MGTEGVQHFPGAVLGVHRCDGRQDLPEDSSVYGGGLPGNGRGCGEKQGLRGSSDLHSPPVLYQAPLLIDFPFSAHILCVNGG